MTAKPHGPSLDRVALVAKDLGDLASNVVFIGGAIAPLLQTDPPFPRARPTSDVDGVIATTTYTESQRFQAKLIKKGFRQDLGDLRHVHRWRGPSGIAFDLVPAGDHLGGSGNPWDKIAIETAVTVSLGSGLTFRHANAPSFLAQKWAAHSDRGREDPLASHDLEDILALVASRPSLTDEVMASETKLRRYISEQSREFLSNPYVEDLLAAHLNNAQDPATVAAQVRRTLEQLSALR